MIGDTKVYYHAAEIELPVKHRPSHATETRMEVHYRGGTDRGLCYPPLAKSVTLALASME